MQSLVVKLDQILPNIWFKPNFTSPNYFQYQILCIWLDGRADQNLKCIDLTSAQTIWPMQSISQQNRPRHLFGKINRGILCQTFRKFETIVLGSFSHIFLASKFETRIAAAAQNAAVATNQDTATDYNSSFFDCNPLLKQQWQLLGPYRQYR